MRYGILVYTMRKSEKDKVTTRKTGWKRWVNYILNGLLALIILVLLIPSWRGKFQTWFTQVTLSSVQFEKNTSVPMPTDQKNWELISDSGLLVNFAEFQGKPVVIQFWATWCTYCKAAFPDLGALKEQLGEDVSFIAVTEEPLDLIEQSGYMDEYDFIYCTQDFPTFFDVHVYPTLVIMDKEMNLVYRMEGSGDINNEENIIFLKKLL